jgi:4-amino-4-deoxy-L-arabinose transferase-like glycosyltransferase
MESLFRQYIDELNFAWAVDDFWHRPNVALMRPLSRVIAFPYLYPYLQTWTVDIFGRNLTGLRVISVILGTLNIPAMYLLARTLFDRPTARIALVLLAAFPPHIHFSRIGLNNIMDPLLATLALAFIARGMIHNRRADYVLGGLFLGLVHYFYEGGRLLLLPLVLSWFIGLLILWRPRLNWRALALVLLTMLLIVVPIYYTLAAINTAVASRLMENKTALNAFYWSQIGNPGRLQLHIERQFIAPLLMYVRDIEGSHFYGGPQGFILPLMVPLLLLGIGYALARWRHPGPLLLILWMLGATAGISLMAAPTFAARFGVTLPALVLFIALGLRYVLALLWPDEKFSRVRAALLTAVVLALAVVQVHYYFNTHLPIFNEQHRAQKLHRDGQDVVYRSVHYPPGSQVYIISPTPPDDIYTVGIMEFMTDDVVMHIVTPDVITRDYLKTLQRGVNYAFFVEPGEDGVIQLLKAYFYLLPPQNSPFEIYDYQQFQVYYAPYLRDYSDMLLDRLDRVRPAHPPQRTL